MFSTEIVIALIGIFGIIITTLGSVYVKMATKNRQYKRELRFRADVLSLKIEFYDWNQIQNELRTLMSETSIDRFTILNAFNGQDDPQWATAIYQIIEGEHKIVSYVHVELDKDYINRLKAVRLGSDMVIDAGDIPDSLVKSTYNSEGIKHAIWFPIRERKLENSKSVGISYCTFASHDDKDLDESTKLHCKRIRDMLSGAVHQAESRC